MSGDRRADRARYQEAGLRRAERVEHWDWAGDLRDEVAFIQRWGGAEEVGNRLAELSNLCEWWLEGRTRVGPDDLDALRGLECARERLAWIYATADVVERQLREDWGVELAPGTPRTLREVRTPGQRGATTRSLLSKAVQETFRALATEGQPERNTKEVRAEIRNRLLDIFHPDELTDDKIRNAINAEMNPDRHA